LQLKRELPKLKMPRTVPIEALFEEPYASIACYPRANPIEIQARIEELRQLGVSAIEFAGKAAASNMPVLGKGYVGVVVVAQVNSQRVALKMRRIDADRPDFSHEAEMLKKANTINVGPKFIAVTENFLLSQLIEGDLFETWLETHQDKMLIRKVLIDVLEQCWRLDEIGLDHGEISKATKHLLMGKLDKPFIVDFETASTMRKVINVTSICQFLFVGNSKAAFSVNQVLGQRNRVGLITALKVFSKNKSRKSFEDLLEICLS
jgi:putative serine/threonine protein kinase